MRTTHKDWDPNPGRRYIIMSAVHFNYNSARPFRLPDGTRYTYRPDGSIRNLDKNRAAVRKNRREARARAIAFARQNPGGAK